MPPLEAQICDVWGVPIAGGTLNNFVEGGAPKVIEPLNDSRMAEFTVSVFDPVSKHLRPLSRIVSITYGSRLVFKGPLLQVTTDYAAGTVRCAAHDMTLRLKHHYHRYGDYPVDVGYPVDGYGMRILVESSIPVESQSDRGVPPNGILWGYDNTTHQGPRPVTDPPGPGDGFWRTIQRGSNVWESVQNLSQVVTGPDFRFRPVDDDHYGKNEEIPPGFCCELDTADRIGSDKFDSVIFEFGAGLDNCESMVHEPDGDAVRNWFITVIPGGEKKRGDTNAKGLVQNNASQVKNGLMQGWESSGQKGDKKTILVKKSQAWLDAYHVPPDYFRITPRVDKAQNVPQYGSDYIVGDTIRARADRGYRNIDVIGRIVQATIGAVDQSGNVKVELEVVPSILADFDEDGDGEGST